MSLKAFEVALDPFQVGLGKQVLFTLVILGGNECRDSFCQGFLRHRRPVIRQGKLDVERKRVRVTGNAAKHRFGFVQLLIG